MENSSLFIRVFNSSTVYEVVETKENGFLAIEVDVKDAKPLFIKGGDIEYASAKKEHGESN